MPKLAAGVRRIPDPNGSFVRWHDLAEFKRDVLQEVRDMLEEAGKTKFANGNESSLHKHEFNSVLGASSAVMQKPSKESAQQKPSKGSILANYANYYSYNDDSKESASASAIVVQKPSKESAQEKTSKGSIPANYNHDSRDSTTNRVSWNDVSDGLHQAILESGDVTADKWGFRGTCWDAAAFVGDPRMMHVPESVVVLFLVTLSLAVQGLFILIVFLSLASSPLDEDTIDGFHLWRTNVGHDVNYVNPLTWESLASRVCRGDSSLESSDRQVQRIQEVENYYENNFPFNGPMMCLLAMFTWILTVSKELHVLKDMWLAILTIPVGLETVHTFDTIGKLELIQIHAVRLGWMASLTCFRVSIAACLLGAGLMFLSVTHSIEDILLNAVALEFVLNVDELLYQSMAPVKTRKLLLLMKGITVPGKNCKWRGVDPGVPTTMVFAFSLLGVFFAFRLIPEIDKMKEAKNELCDGHMDFSYGTSEFSMTLWGSDEEISTLQAKMDQFFASGRYKMIRGVIEKGGDASKWKADKVIEDHRAPALSGPGFSVVNAAIEKQPYWESTLNPRCLDILYAGASYASNPLYGIIRDTMRDAVHNQTVSLCSEVSQYCGLYKHPGAIVRWFCPVTCGCPNPGGALALPYNNNGCPAYCLKHPTYIEEQSRRSCNQPSDDLLVTDKVWQRLAANIAEASSVWGDLRAAYYGFVASQYLQKGCDIITNPTPPVRGGTEFCRTTILKDLAFWCPAACGCNTSVAPPTCPQSCAMNTPIPIGNQLPESIAISSPFSSP